MHPTTRPRTSKPRGTCQYYNTPRGCFAGDKCKFLHGEPPSEDSSLLTPYDRAKRCRFYAQGFCKRGDACWFIHASESKSDEDEDELCSICFEKPTTYGLLGGCSHIFCTTCIKQWRDPTNKPGGVLDSGNTKKCPMCRASSKFITPSSRFWKEGTEEKDRVVQAYKDSMARVPCRYFQKSLQKNKDKPLCPYGKDCFYQHLNDDGTPYIFKDGVDASMRKYRLNFPARGGLSFSFGSDDIHFMPFTSLLDTMTIPIPLPNPRNPSRRDRERHVLDNFLRMQPRPVGGGTQPTHTQTQTSRRLREVSRSLDMLHDAIGDNGTSLEHLSDAVEALRAGLGGLEAGARLRGAHHDTAGTGAATDEDWFPEAWDDLTGGEMTAEEEAARQEDVVMERLEDLADQMLASIDALQRESRGLARATSPENDADNEDDNGEMPSLEPIPHSDSDDSDDSSMPQLASVSNTSESEDDDDDDVPDLDSVGLGGDSDGELWPWQRHLQRLGGNGANAANNTANRRRHQQRRSGGSGGNANRNNTALARAARPAATSAVNGDASANSSENVNEDATRPTTSTAAISLPSASPSPSPLLNAPTPTTGSDPTSRQANLPEFTVTGDSTASSSSPLSQPASPSPPPAKFELKVEASSSRTSLSASSMVAEPPFVTDGRGRVVWTSSSDEVSPSSSSSAVETQCRSPIRRNSSVEMMESDLKVDSGAGLANDGNNGCRDRSGDGAQPPVVGTEEGSASGGRRSGGGGMLFDWFNSLF